MKVLMIKPQAGGINPFARVTADNLRAAGHAVGVLEVPDGGRWPLRKAVAAVRCSAREAKAVDVVHVDFGSNDQQVMLAGLLLASLGATVVAVAHDADRLVINAGASLVPQIGRYGKKLAFGVAEPAVGDRIRSRFRSSVKAAVALTSSAAEEWTPSGVPVVVAAHGAGAPVDNRRPGDSDYLLFAGFVGYGKGLDLLLQAWSRLADRHPRMKLLIVGGPAGADAATQNYFAAQQSVARRLDRCDWVRESSDGEFEAYIANAAAVVMPYRSSSPASGVLTHALVNGRPVICSDAQAFAPYFRSPGRAPGLAFEVDDVDVLTTQIEKLLLSPEERDRLGRLAREHASIHSWDRYIEGLLAAYDLATRP